MGKAKGTQERSLSWESGSGLVGAGRSTAGRRFPGGGPRVRPANLAPPRRAPLTRGTQSAAFLFFFVSVPAAQPGDPLPGRQRPLSPAAAPAVRLHPLPAPLTSARLLFAPALLTPAPSFTTLASRSQQSPPGAAQDSGGVRGLSLAGQEHPTSGCSTGRSCSRRIRGAGELSRGPGEGFLAQAAGPEGGLPPRPASGRGCELSSARAPRLVRARAHLAERLIPVAQMGLPKVDLGLQAG